jgi:hypothetical protein
LAISIGVYATLRFSNNNKVAAWSWGTMWGLPLCRVSWINIGTLLLGAKARKTDLSWIAHFTWSPLIGTSEPRNLDKSDIPILFFKTFLFILWIIVTLAFLYLCILTLLNPWKFKTSCAEHLHIKLLQMPLA